MLVLTVNTVAQAVEYTVFLVILAVATTIAYNIWLHPLSVFPGPKISAASNLYEVYITISGRSHEYIRDLHRKYGPVVRVAPNQLSFANAAAWKDIYGSVPGRKFFLKSSFYDVAPDINIITARDQKEHAKLRRILSPAFSTRALSEQEHFIHDHADAMMVHLNGDASRNTPSEMVTWYHWFTFDVIGDLAFGEAFGCVRNARPHPWVAAATQSLAANAYGISMRHIPFFNKLRWYILPKRLIDALREHMNFSHEKVQQRLQLKTERKDFLSRIFTQKESAGISVKEIGSNAHIMAYLPLVSTLPQAQLQLTVISTAGTDTTASVLSAATFFVCHNPAVYRKLVEELRGTFSNYSEIIGRTTEGLPYLKAVIDESLRIYPPVPVGMPRESPGEVVDGVYVPPGAECFVSSYTATHWESNFSEPEKFSPERWLAENGDKKEASQPFLLGPRGCIGQNLAMLELRLVLAKLFWLFDAALVEDNFKWLQNSLVFTSWDKPKLEVVLKLRHGVQPPVSC